MGNHVIQQQIQMQHVNVKLILQNHAASDLEPLIPVFHEWIQDQPSGELLLDIADYRHVPAGPGVVLIGHEGDYSVDNTDDRLGVRYNRKAALEGSNEDRLKQAARAALHACRRLEEDPRLGLELRFGGQEIEIFINDRLLAPNSDATRDAADPEIRAFAQKLFRGNDYSVTYESDRRKLFKAVLKSAKPFSAAELLESLG
ncbi:MAG: hypothetical protein LAO19_14305 [Acidobacteriia bacterium]|nr:hypothetical protein [Terriglobia bacterium]